MKLSDAIRLGSMLKPQGFGARSISNELTSCALGAARDAIGCQIEQLEEAYIALYARFPILSSRETHEDYPDSHDVMGSIWRLNDHDRWTREQIADWVETIERAAESAEHPQPVTVEAHS